MRVGKCARHWVEGKEVRKKRDGDVLIGSDRIDGRLTSETDGSLIVSVARRHQNFAVVLSVDAHVEVPVQRYGTPLGAGVVIVVPRVAHLWIGVCPPVKATAAVAVVVQADIDRRRCCGKAKENR